MPVEYKELNKESYDFISVGDLIKVNDWKVPYKVVAVSEHYILATRNQFGDLWYTIIDKVNLWCGPDDRILGPMFDIENEPEKELAELESTFGDLTYDSDRLSISIRRGMDINQLFVKHKLKR